MKIQCKIWILTWNDITSWYTEPTFHVQIRRHCWSQFQSVTLLWIYLFRHLLFNHGIKCCQGTDHKLKTVFLSGQLKIRVQILLYWMTRTIPPHILLPFLLPPLQVPHHIHLLPLKPVEWAGSNLSSVPAYAINSTSGLTILECCLKHIVDFCTVSLRHWL